MVLDMGSVVSVAVMEVLVLVLNAVGKGGGRNCQCTDDDAADDDADNDDAADMVWLLSNKI